MSADATIETDHPQLIPLVADFSTNIFAVVRFFCLIGSPFNDIAIQQYLLQYVCISCGLCLVCYVSYVLLKKLKIKTAFIQIFMNFLGGFLGSPRALCLMSSEIRSQQYLRVRIFIMAGTQQYLLSAAEAL